ncbi:PQQ-dependent sugar dehydrogenase [Chthonobacter albigriseus]|uniref:PQQ-dependent sugar dehydrogenase n=1 Tax=Chthonobacter albigriseus TaxID=1683161 RepID=UPI0015EF5080|nr:PQQ-dependent sugar dehydrogenase [Chthonobacter albigriseus]
MDTRLTLAGAVALTLIAGPAAAAGAVETTVVAEGLDQPWGLDFLPDGSMIVTEKSGALRLVAADGTVSEPIAGVPEVDTRSQGGLLDVTLHPDFANNRFVYFSYAEAGEGGTSTAVARGRLSADGRSLEFVERIFQQQPKVDSTKHYGSRIVFDGQGHVFVTLGERSDEEFRGQAQDLDSHLGKIVRLNEDGSVPADNPFVGRDGARPEIWSYGHRNVQAAVLHPETGALWEIEHGPMGGDELNIAEAGKNYGWPLVSYGKNYSGTPVNEGEAEGEGFEPPIIQWTPVIAPSGMIVYGGDAFPDWKGDVFVGGLRSTALVRLEVNGKDVREAERLLEDQGNRIRDVAEGPDGAIYVITDDSNGQIIRLMPAD